MERQRLTRSFLYKACPRCHGDLVLEPELEPHPLPLREQTYLCLQCGRRLVVPLEVRQPAAVAR